MIGAAPAGLAAYLDFAALVGGVGPALLAAKVASLTTGAASTVGIAAAVVLFGLPLLDQQQRATDRVLRPPTQASSASWW